jgi:4-hydroxy-3-methylbut-2-enyl diphosphate reductase
MEVARHYEQGREIVLIGHHGHPEVVGTLGQLPDGAIRLIESVDEARAFVPQDANRLAYVTQTTLSLDDTAEIVDVLKSRFPGIGGPVKEDICYATTNRQNAVKAIAPRIDGLIVVGGPKSSNSLRLVEVAERAGCRFAVLVERAADIPWSKLQDAEAIGITAGASAPEIIVEEVVEAFRERFEINVEVVTTLQERVIFNVPREVRVSRAATGQR